MISCSITKLPIVLKGILTPQDALLAIESGAKAIVVSNHGARQVDGIPATVYRFFRNLNFGYFVTASSNNF